MPGYGGNVWVSAQCNSVNVSVFLTSRCQVHHAPLFQTVPQLNHWYFQPYFCSLDGVNFACFFLAYFPAWKIGGKGEFIVCRFIVWGCGFVSIGSLHRKVITVLLALRWSSLRLNKNPQPNLSEYRPEPETETDSLLEKLNRIWSFVWKPEVEFTTVWENLFRRRSYQIPLRLLISKLEIIVSLYRFKGDLDGMCRIKLSNISTISLMSVPGRKYWNYCCGASDATSYHITSSLTIIYIQKMP